MPLTEDQKQCLQNKLDKCDAALDDTPELATIYDTMWRQKYREKLLSEDSMSYVAYSAPLYEALGQFPAYYQHRLEEGAVILLPKLSKGEKNHLVKRMQGDGCLSAEEELLLARGFALEFGSEAITGPSGDPSSRRPEFVVNANSFAIDIEAKGLQDSANVRQLNEAARQSEQNFWLSNDPAIDNICRVQSALKKKLLHCIEGRIRVVILTQYSWPTPDKSINLIREVARNPDCIKIPQIKHPLAVAFAWNRYIQGVWFNTSVMCSFNMEEDLCKRLRRAIRGSFYPRPDGLFFDEKIDDTEHRGMLDKM